MQWDLVGMPSPFWRLRNCADGRAVAEARKVPARVSLPDPGSWHGKRPAGSVATAKRMPALCPLQRIPPLSPAGAPSQVPFASVRNGRCCARVPGDARSKLGPSRLQKKRLGRLPASPLGGPLVQPLFLPRWDIIKAQGTPFFRTYLGVQSPSLGPLAPLGATPPLWPRRLVSKVSRLDIRTETHSLSLSLSHGDHPRLHQLRVIWLRGIFL